MMKREREDALERGLEGVGNGNKIQRVAGHFSERTGDDSKGTGSQDANGSLSARKAYRQRPSNTYRGKDEIGHDIYKEGKRFKFEGSELPEGDSPKLLVRIPVEHLQYRNRQVKSRQLWGVDTYTHDSDLVAILMHCGYISASTGLPRDLVAEVQVLVEYLPKQQNYPSCHRNGVRSRAWGDYQGGVTLRVAKCVLITRNGHEEELQPFADGAGSVVATFTPSSFSRVIGTRANSSNTDRRQRTMQEVPIQYNLCNEPWLKYSMQVIADRGLKPSQLTSARLHKEVLYMETGRQRFELSLESHAPSGDPEPNTAELYRFARCKKPYPLQKMRKLGMPLPAAETEVINQGLHWEDIQWSPAGVSVKGKAYSLLRLHFTLIRAVEPEAPKIAAPATLPAASLAANAAP